MPLPPTSHGIRFFMRPRLSKKCSGVAADLNRFPQAGRVVPELNQPDLRERFVYSYRLIYRIEPQRILVTAVIHGKRLLEDTTADRLTGK